MRALVVSSKQKAFFNLCTFGLLGPFLTLLPLTLVFGESGLLGLGMSAATLLALFFTISYGLIGLSLAALTFAVAVGMSHVETLSVWTLWSALTSGALVTYFGSRELVESLGERESKVTMPPEDHCITTLQKLLQLTRHQLVRATTDLESYKSRVKLAEGLFDEQNGQISALFEQVRAAQAWRLELDQLQQGEEDLLKKACAYDQLFEQFVEKQGALAHVRRELELVQIESEGLARDVWEKVEDSVIERLKDQLACALEKLEKACHEQKELMGLISLWSKSA